MKQLKSEIKASGDKAKDLERLNNLYWHAADLSGDYTAVPSEEILDTVRRVCQNFDDLRRQMDEVKFDMAAGEYFYRFNDEGEEVFAVRLEIKLPAQTFRVPARTAGEACDRCRITFAMASECPAEQINAEDVSR